jgi:SAM-dependent methyltransferase
MIMPDRHAMLPVANHDEMAEQFFIRDLKMHIGRKLDPLAEKMAAVLDPGERNNARVETVYNELQEQPSFGRFLSTWRASQDVLWSLIGHSVDRQRGDLEERAAIKQPLGSVTLDPDFQQPSYLEDGDVHLMPGGYGLDDGGVGQGAVMDNGGAIYMLGMNGGFLNDGRGWTLASHLKARWPDFAPEKILEMGCGIGASIVPLVETYPEAEVHGIDVGASVLRYAHARAESLDAAVHFKQGDAEKAPYPDESFDCVFSCALFHETSPEAISNIIKESMRLLRPGGVVAHLEVPQRYEEVSLWNQVRGEVEREYNNEPNWKTAISADYDSLLEMAGFEDIATGYQDAAREAVPGNDGFGGESKGVFRSWFVASGIKPKTA